MTEIRLTDYFKAVERRFEKLGPEAGSSLQTRLCGNVIEMRFLLKEHADCVKKYLYTPILEEPAVPDAVLYYWYDDSYAFLSEESSGRTAIWQSHDDSGTLFVNPGIGIFGIDYQREAYFQTCEPNGGTDYIIHGHSMAPLLARWAIRNDFLFLHSACVGYAGKGVMFSARGGGGKSTLAISCLLDPDFDFVSDDYIVVNQKGPMTARPVYSVIGINQDMAAILKPDMPILRTEPKRADKMYLDASGCNIRESLPVNAIVFPHLCDADSPGIIRTDPGPVLAKVMQTSAQNMRNFRNPETYRIMAKRLMGIPVYEFRLTKDLFRNRDCLKAFIKKEL